MAGFGCPPRTASELAASDSPDQDDAHEARIARLMTLSIETSKASRFAPTRERRRDIVGNGTRHQRGGRSSSPKKTTPITSGPGSGETSPNGFAEEQELLGGPCIR